MGFFENAKKKTEEIAAQLKAKSDEIAPGALDKAKAFGKEALEKTEALASEGRAVAEKLAEQTKFGYAIDTILTGGDVNPKNKAMHETALADNPAYAAKFNELAALYAAKAAAAKASPDRNAEEALRDTLNTGVAAVSTATDKFKAHKALAEMVIQ
jgi:hypothetical protein